MFAHLTFNTDICATTAMKFSPWNSRFCLVTIVYSLMVTSINMFTANQQFKQISLYILLAHCMVSKGHYAWNICMEMTETLGIRVFRVKPRVTPFKGNADLNFTMQKQNKE